MLKDSYSTRNPRFIAAMGLLVSLTVASEAATWYVRPEGGGAGTGWGDALGSFQTAIAAATAGDEIWGASGVYNESLTLKAGIALYGGFAAVETVREDRDFVANPTILDATGLNQRVITADRSENVTIDGFTIRNGNSSEPGGGIYFDSVSSATVSNCTISGNTAFDGGGVYCRSSSPTLTNCTITGNTSSSGGGMYCSFSSPTLAHCTISDNTVIGASDSSNGGGGVYCFTSSPDLTNCTISGNTSSSGGGGLHCRESSSPILTGCTIASNTAMDSGGGVHFRESSSATLTHCTVSGNTASGGGGVYCSRSSATMTQCKISGNTASSGSGLFCSSSSPTLTHCTITGNSATPDVSTVTCSPSDCTIWRDTAGYGGGVFISGSSSWPDLTNCIFWNPGNEIFVLAGAPVVRYSCAQGGFPGEGNIDAYPQFVDPLNGDWRLRDGSPCIDRGVDVGLPYNGTGPDMGVWEAPENYSQGPPDPVPQRFHVNAGAAKGGDGLTWETAFFSVGEALRHSTTTDEIWVSTGTYHESIQLERGTALYGGFAGTETMREARNVMVNPTVLDAAGLNQRVVTVDRSEGVTIDGFTILNGSTEASGGGIAFSFVSSAIMSNCTISGNMARDFGGGVLCNRSSPILTNCTITGNTAPSGGGVFCWSSSPTLTDCTITGNTARVSGGGMFPWFSRPMLTNCTISDNTSDRNGGGFYCSSSSSTLTHCMISGNTASESGAGVYVSLSSFSPTMTYCTISDNTADRSGGGVYCVRSSPVLTYCTIAGNTATESGGGVYCDRSSPGLTNCTVADNTTSSDGAGLAILNTSSPTLINSILWNGGEEVFVNSATAEVTFSAVQGGYPGQGNIDEDPMFVDPEQSDYRLAMGSPCIDSGSNGAVLRLGPSVLALGDLDGRMRVWDGDSDGFAAVDMGAYEFGPPPFVGDISGDSRVNHLDLFRFQQVWKQEGDGIIPEADQDGDRTIGPTDLTILLHVWGNVTGP